MKGNKKIALIIGIAIIGVVLSIITIVTVVALNISKLNNSNNNKSNNTTINNSKDNKKSNSAQPVVIDKVYKPIIYLYPEEEKEVTVKLLREDSITCSYPKYKDEWKVIAKTNGNLKDLKTSRDLYALYYESENNVEFKVEKDGFVVKGEDITAFLEEKLDMLGLTERETEEFIVYWLPKLEVNEYNYIRFATADEINQNMPIEINPTPDTIIRVIMTYKKLDNPINVEEQILETPNRTGFVAVEWGGTEIQ